MLTKEQRDYREAWRQKELLRLKKAEKLVKEFFGYVPIGYDMDFAGNKGRMLDLVGLVKYSMEDENDRKYVLEES